MTSETIPRVERCAVCGCLLHRQGNFALPTAEGRSHATAHHYAAERFFPRTGSRAGKRYRYKTPRDGIFQTCPWGMRGKTTVCCYECHEDLLHNPVLLPDDIARFAELIRRHGLDEDQKPEDRERIAGRIELLHTVIQAGLEALLRHEPDNDGGNPPWRQDANRT